MSFHIPSEENEHLKRASHLIRLASKDENNTQEQAKENDTFSNDSSNSKKKKKENRQQTYLQMEKMRSKLSSLFKESKADNHSKKVENQNEEDQESQKQLGFSISHSFCSCSESNCSCYQSQSPSRILKVESDQAKNMNAEKEESSKDNFYTLKSDKFSNNLNDKKLNICGEEDEEEYDEENKQLFQNKFLNDRISFTLINNGRDLLIPTSYSLELLTPPEDLNEIEDQINQIPNINYEDLSNQQTKIKIISDDYSPQQRKLLDGETTRTKSNSRNEALKALMAKSKFKTDSLPEKALRILIYKRREQRNSEDLNILQQATINMNFFQELLSKKSNLQNNVHQNLCKAMNFEFVKKGGIVFYTGDIPDRFYILLKGEVAVLLKKQQDEIEKLKKANAIESQLQQRGESEEKKKSKFSLRRYLIFKKFQKRVQILQIIIKFCKISFNQRRNSKQLQSINQSVDYQSSHSNEIISDHQSCNQRDSVSSSCSKQSRDSILGPSPKHFMHQESSPKVFSSRQSAFFQIAQSLHKSSNNNSNSQSKAKAHNQTSNNSKMTMSKMNNTHSSNSKNSPQVKQLQKIVMNKLLPSQQILLDRKKQQLKQFQLIDPTKDVSGMFKLPTTSNVDCQSHRSSISSYFPNSLDSSKQNYQVPLTPSAGNDLTKNESLQSSSPKNGIHASNSNYQKQLQVSQSFPKRASFMARKLKVDIHKVCLGVRLSKVFLPALQVPLNLGGPRINSLFHQQNEAFKKIIPKLDLMSLENSPHFFDENVFKYFHAINLGEGRVFGDLGILTKKPRAATIVCLEDCYFGVLNLDDYSKILMDQKKKKMQKSIKFLASTFNVGLSIEKMSKISQFFEKKFFSSGERIYDEGDQTNFIYLVKKGEVEVFRKMTTSYGISQEQRINVSVCIIGQKTYFGEDDALFQRKRKYSVVARIDTNVLVSKKKDFLKVMNEIPELHAELREMAIRKESWRDQIYNDMFITRKQIKQIENIKKKKRYIKHISASTSKCHNAPNAIEENKQIAISLVNGEEQVRNQLLLMGEKAQMKAYALKRIAEQDLFQSQQDASEYHSSSPSQSDGNYQLNSYNNTFSCQSSPKQSILPYTAIHKPQPLVKDFSSHERIKKIESNVISSQIGTKLGDPYSKLSPRLQQILIDNKGFINKCSNIKEMSEKIKKKKLIFLKNLQGKCLSAIEVYKETRDVCMGENEIYKKLEKVAERRKHLKMESSGENSRISSNIMQGKISSTNFVENLLKSLKNKNSSADLKEGQLVITSQASKRSSSLYTLLASPPTNEKDKNLIFFNHNQARQAVQSRNASLFFSTIKSHKLADNSYFPSNSSSQFSITPSLYNSKNSLIELPKSPISSPNPFQPFSSIKKRQKMVIVNHMGKPLTYAADEVK